MSDNNDYSHYIVGFDRGEEDETWLSIIDRRQPEGPLRVRHRSRSWGFTAAHFASAMDRIESLEQQLAERDQRILAQEAVLALMPTTDDGVHYVPCGDDRTFWAVWRDADGPDEEPWKVSPCRVPQDPDECALDFVWIIESADDECEVLAVYASEEAAIARAKKEAAP